MVQSGDPGPGDTRRSARRGDRAARDRKRRRRRRRNVVALLIALVVLGGSAFAVVQYVLPQFDGFGGTQETSDDYPGPGQGSVDVVIPEGASGTAMAQVLFEADVVRTAGAFTQAFTANPDAAGIQPGTYRLLLQMRAADAVTALLDSANRVQTKVTIPEGLQVSQILDKLASVTALPVADFTDAMADTAATGLPAESGGNYEGWLFGSTYTFEPGTTPTQMIAAMVAQTISVLDAKGVAAADRQRVLTVASLVEREARTPEDRAKVARGIQNRLDVEMKLDIDASVAYGAGKSGTELTEADLAADTPYNLYVHTGLPPTPIASPSETSIDATLAPADGPWLWWVAINLDTGETRFAETYPEHLQNVALLRQWQAENEAASADG
ncbi:MAG: endolytic transglycosylase MltG [Cellulomonadaceae bacterium]|nr:endolytic transglycosylase MltG [Cellulomonadaceae bacterium]